MKINREPAKIKNGIEGVKIIVQDDHSAQVLDRFTVFRIANSCDPWKAWTADILRNKEAKARREEIADQINKEERER